MCIFLGSFTKFMAVEFHFKNEDIQITISVPLRCYDLRVNVKVNIHCCHSVIALILNIEFEL